jgi:hypothetical protein
MGKTIREAFVEPFLKVRDYVLNHPLGKRLPNGFRTSRDSRNRNGNTNIDIFCSQWQTLANDCPHLITDADIAFMDPVFELRDKLQANNEN